MISELYNKRKKLVEQMKENNYNASEIIANLYSDVSHFIYELLQNAEDSEATFINFELKEDSFFITHNGKLFNYNDVDAITTIGFSTKKDDLNKIGKFGAGFKSVFAITNTPRIYSGDLSFEIQDYIVPRSISKIELEENLTAIELLFNSQKINSEKAHQIISDKLLKLESESLLFLKNIQKIQWSFLENNGSFNKVKKKSENCEYIDIIINNNGVTNTKSYIRIDRIVQIHNKNLTLSIAYALENNQIIPIDNSLLSVFFPTKVNTYYKFLLQAPYKTTPNRENIPFDDEDNQIIASELSKLVGESFLILKEENLYNINFLEKMISFTKYYNNTLYMAIYNELIKSFREYDLLPTSLYTYCKSSDLILGENEDIIKFLESDIEKYANKKYFFINKYSNEFTKYLNRELSIQTFNNDQFISKLTSKDLEQKNDEWLISFYELLSIQTFSKVYLTIKPIMKLADNSFIGLYKDHSDTKPQVYLPIEKKSKFKTLHNLFIENDSLKEFINKYKVNKPNNISELKEFILPKYISTPKITLEEYIEDFIFIIDTYNNSNKIDKEQIENLCKDKFLILSFNENFYKAQDVYINTDELKEWFKSTNNTIFIYPTLNNDKTYEFLNAIGINTKPIITNNSPYIDGIKANLENMNFDNSIKIWNYLIKHLTNFYITKEQSSLHYSSQTINYLKLILNNTAWLKSKQEDGFVKPLELIFQNLDSGYFYPDNIKNYLTLDIKFKPNKIQQIEEELNCRIVDKIEFEEFKKWKDEQNKKDQKESTENNFWTSEINPNKIDIIEVRTYSNLNYRRMNLSYQTPSSYVTYKSSNTIMNYNNIESRKAIGDWGEEFVNNYLKQKYKGQSDITIKWLNQKDLIGIGYDFVILEKDVEIEYIEVKSKVSYYPSSIEISGTQWEWARELYDNNNGEKFKIYLVLGAGKDNASISIIDNPIKQWIDGELKAHPINIQL